MQACGVVGVLDSTREEPIRKGSWPRSACRAWKKEMSSATLYAYGRVKQAVEELERIVTQILARTTAGPCCSHSIVMPHAEHGQVSEAGPSSVAQPPCVA